MSSEDQITQGTPTDSSVYQYGEAIRTVGMNNEDDDPNTMINGVIRTDNDGFWVKHIDDSSNTEEPYMPLALTEAFNMNPQQYNNRLEQQSQPYGSPSSSHTNNTMNSLFSITPQTTTTGMLSSNMHDNLARGFQGSELSSVAAGFAQHGHRASATLQHSSIDTNTSHRVAEPALATHIFPRDAVEAAVPNHHQAQQQQQQHLVGMHISVDVPFTIQHHPALHNWSYGRTMSTLLGQQQQHNTPPANGLPTVHHHSRDNLTAAQRNQLFQNSVAVHPNYPLAPRPPASTNLQMVAAATATNQFMYHFSPTVTVTQNAAASINQVPSAVEENTNTKQYAVSSSSSSSGKNSIIRSLSLTPPVRPLSAYNYFFRFERERLLKYTHFGDEAPKKLPPHYFDHYTLTIYNSKEFQEQLLNEQWSRDPNVKRKHCKSHGRISFRDLAKRIAQNWHDLPKPTQDVFRAIAKQDHQRYLREMQTYNATK